jgi:AcrR family transcriptional regulator
MPGVRALAAEIDATDSSRTKLLRAAERQIVLHGAHSLTTRLIETYAGFNSSLIGYNFGALNGLLAELLHANLDLILADRAHRLAVLAHMGGEDSAEAVLEAFLARCGGKLLITPTNAHSPSYMRFSLLPSASCART